MEPLLKQLRELPRRFTALPAAARYGLAGGVLLLALAAAAMTMLGDGGGYQYAFTNLTTEDATEAQAVLKAANVPFRAEANGAALAVPANKVHEARLMLAAAGLPRGGGIGFEIFDRGDLGISEFTQKVNLRRAIEGELGRTISRLGPVRSARVHITLPEKGLYRDENRKAAAAVVLNLQPGRTVEERELAGIRHLVSAAVTGLSPDGVTVVDGRGTVLAGDRSEGAKLASEQRSLESSLEQRVIDLLEPVVGRSAVVAKVTATLDTREMESTADNYDPESATVRSERKVTEQTNADSSGGAGVAGAAANQPLGAAGPGPGGGNRNQTNREDTLKNYEVSKTTTRTTTRGPRLTRLSAAVLVSGVDGKPRAEAEMRRLGELAKHALGFDADRGDRFDISSAPFVVDPEAAALNVPVWQRPETLKLAGLGLAALLVVGALIILARARGKGGHSAALALLKPGGKVSELEAALAKGELAGLLPRSELEAVKRGDMGGKIAEIAAAAAAPVKDPQVRARELSDSDPARAAHLLRAWIAADGDHKETSRA
jgi:flagellar M-ring protein FliF